MYSDTKSIEEKDALNENTDSLSYSIVQLWREFKDISGDTLGLLATEGRFAAVSFVVMIGLSIAVIVLVLVALLMVEAGLLFWLVRLGYAWGSVIIFIAFTNVGVAALLAWWVYRISKNLLFQHTRRVIKSDESKEVPIAQTS